MDERHVHFAKWKKDPKSYVLYNSIYIIFCKRQNSRVRDGGGVTLTAKGQTRGFIVCDETFMEMIAEQWQKVHNDES